MAGSNREIDSLRTSGHQRSASPTGRAVPVGRRGGGRCPCRWGFLSAQGLFLLLVFAPGCSPAETPEVKEIAVEEEFKPNPVVGVEVEVKTLDMDIDQIWA